jgi:hypothetical protein
MSRNGVGVEQLRKDFSLWIVIPYLASCHEIALLEMKVRHNEQYE